MITKQWDGHNKKNGSDKVYHVAIIETKPGEYDVLTAYAARGASMNRGNCGLGFTDLKAAQKAFNKQVNAKSGKSGYDDAPGISGNGVFAAFGASLSSGTTTAPPVSTVSSVTRYPGTGPMLLNAIDESELAYYLTSDEWGMQEKMDGERRMAVLQKNEEPFGINKLSNVVPVSFKAAQAMKAIGIDDMHLDAEEVGDDLYCFGLIRVNGVDITNISLQQAQKQLEVLLSIGTGNGLEIVPMAIGTTAKKAMFEEIKAKGGEGVVFKRLSATYSPGRPNSGGDAVKFKFKASASCIVVGGKNGKRSVEVAVLDQDTLIAIGNVTIPPNHNIPSVDTLIEVEYLYVVNRGGCLFQPVYKGPRNDVERHECHIGQLVYKGEARA